MEKDIIRDENINGLIIASILLIGIIAAAIYIYMQAVSLPVPVENPCAGAMLDEACKIIINTK